MDSLSIELVHYMTDWNLYCKYSASIVSSQAGYSNGIYLFEMEDNT